MVLVVSKPECRKGRKADAVVRVVQAFFCMCMYQEDEGPYLIERTNTATGRALPW